MSTEVLALPFGGDTLALRVPASWQVTGLHVPRRLPGAPDPAAALEEGLIAPVGAAPLADLAGRRIVLAVDDVSRPTPVHRWMAALLRHLEARGARRQDLRVLFALGVHRPMSPAEAAAKLGPENLEGLAWENHDARDGDLNPLLGATSRGTPVRLNRRLAEADLILCVGALEPHPLLGFGGGLKMILPGLAHEETIAANHMQGVSPTAWNFVGAPESPMRLDLEEAAGMLRRPVFLVNALLNTDLEVVRFVCGDPVAAHREGVRVLAEAAACAVEGLADLAITLSDPLNADLRQGMKAIAHAERAVRDGGTIVGLLECRGGIGDISIPPRSLPNGLLRFILRRLGPGRVLGFVDRVKRGAGTEERFLSHFSLQVVRKNRILVWSPGLPPDTGRRMGIFRQLPDPQAAIDDAARHLPRHARVHVFPHGGASFPVPIP
ncbi:MAG: nickel-dependent lactate racemase [Deltaproteobacteria bacterium]|nr:nickel-dependent lactate racemase [Deltaproteobacteria bacterium]